MCFPAALLFQAGLNPLGNVTQVAKPTQKLHLWPGHALLSSFLFPHRRAVAQRCPVPPMLNLISIGGQHQGSVPCSSHTSWAPFGALSSALISLLWVKLSFCSCLELVNCLAQLVFADFIILILLNWQWKGTSVSSWLQCLGRILTHLGSTWHELLCGKFLQICETEPFGQEGLLQSASGRTKPQGKGGVKWK